jgi:hypothetical protein
LIRVFGFGLLGDLFLVPPRGLPNEITSLARNHTNIVIPHLQTLISIYPAVNGHQINPAENKFARNGA